MARAMRPDSRPSPFSRNSAARDSSGRLFTRSAAVRPVVGSIRMSSGPSTRNEKPRSTRSSWGELTPRSKRAPERRPNEGAERISGSDENGAPTSETRSPKMDRRARAACSAAGSRSSPTIRNAGYASSSAAACPPPPTVASTTAPGGTEANSETTSSRSTGMCSNEWAICSPPAGGSRGRWRSGRPARRWVEWPSSAPVEELHMVHCVPCVSVVVLRCVLSLLLSSVPSFVLASICPSAPGATPRLPRGASSPPAAHARSTPSDSRVRPGRSHRVRAPPYRDVRTSAGVRGSACGLAGRPRPRLSSTPRSAPGCGRRDPSLLAPACAPSAVRIRPGVQRARQPSEFWVR